MARPVVSDLAEELFTALGFHQDADATLDWPLLRWCQAWVAPIDPVYEIVREHEDGTPAWGLLFDATAAPVDVLPYLAQYVGVEITPEMDEAQIRAEIAEPTGWKRGRTDSIKIAIQRTLTGGKRVILRPRTPEVGRHYIRTLTSETPDESRTAALARAVVPAWEVLDYAAIDGVTWADIEAGWEDFDALTADFSTFEDLADILPDELPEP